MRLVRHLRRESLCQDMSHRARIREVKVDSAVGARVVVLAGWNDLETVFLYSPRTIAIWPGTSDLICELDGLSSHERRSFESKRSQNIIGNLDRWKPD